MQAVTRDPLSMPVGALMRPAARVAPEDSLRLGVARLRESGVSVIPLTSGHVLVGAITERGVLQCLAEGTDLDSACEQISVAPPTVKPYETGAQAMRLLEESTESTLIVIDDENRVMGVITPSDLVERRRGALRPSTVGGMATPFGVYLTTGTVRAGASGFALMTTGMTLFTLLYVAQVTGLLIADRLLAAHAPVWTQNLAMSGWPLVMFLVLMRIVPLAGTHGAEHQVVHAIERGEDLVPGIVRRMPRVHPRCGTNLAAALTLFLGIAGSSFIANFEARTLLALLVTAVAWKPLGSALQYYITTRPASPKQLAGGIRAGEQLLERYESTRVGVPSIPLRIWNSGMLHVISGSLIVFALLLGISAVFGIDIGMSAS